MEKKMKPKLEDVNALAEKTFEFIKTQTDNSQLCFYAILGIATQLACMGSITKEEYQDQIGKLHDFYMEKLNVH